MDVFAGLVREGRAHLRDAAVLAAHQLGVFAALGTPLTAEALAAALGVAPRRLRALLDVLVLEGALVRVALPGGAGLGRAEVPPAPAPLPPFGWGQLAAVIGADRPLSAASAFADEAEACARFHRHLGEAGQGPARELAADLAPAFQDGGVLLDAGGGLGTYTAALLGAAPAARAVLIDRPEVIAMARECLGIYGERVELRASDLLEAPLDPGDQDRQGYRVALICNVLHLYGPGPCARLVRRAAEVLAPGGEVVVKDLLVYPDRSGPPAGLYFALNMALFTAAGEVYDATEIGGWLGEAGLAGVRVEQLASSPESVLVRGRRP